MLSFNSIFIGFQIPSGVLKNEQLCRLSIALQSSHNDPIVKRFSNTAANCICGSSNWVTSWLLLIPQEPYTSHYKEANLRNTC